MAACLADAMMTGGLGNGQMGNFDALVARVHALTSYNLRRKILLERLEPSNWHHTFAELVAKELAARITDKPLTALPSIPRFLFCATDMVFGVNWIYTHDCAGDYEAGYTKMGIDQIQIAHAAAASACFPPIFEPIETLVLPANLSGGDAIGPDADSCRTKIRLSDGGVYDNMGLEPVWKAAETVLVSDAGGLFDYAPDRGTISDVKRYTDIMGNQARAVRKRFLIESLESGVGPGGLPDFKGTYWGTVGYRAKYDSKDTLGYSAGIAKLIAEIRTDLDSFSPGECAALENHGYLMADVAIKVHVPELYRSESKLQPPYPDFMDETKIRAALKDSAKQRL
jgi:NTE family protein